MLKRLSIFLTIAFLFLSCGNRGEGDKNTSKSDEDKVAKELLQGIWLNEETELPLMRVEGDTLYYVDSQNAPVYFKVVKDTLYTFGGRTSKYPIDRQSEYEFWFHSLSDASIKLFKSENPDDSLSFGARTVEIIPIYTEVTSKDSIISYDNRSFRGYVYINPSQMKVYKTSYTADGLSMDNVYYDNVIHICVYEGKKCHYAKDIYKNEFAELLDDEFLEHAILSDMDFVGVDSTGFHYIANLCIPESSVCNLIELTITKEGSLQSKVLK